MGQFGAQTNRLAYAISETAVLAVLSSRAAAVVGNSVLGVVRISECSELAAGREARDLVRGNDRPILASI